jgi:hypothetical protein
MKSISRDIVFVFSQDCDSHNGALEESSGLNLDHAEALVDTENNINTARLALKHLIVLLKSTITSTA